MASNLIKLLSFDLDNTLYDNRPVIQLAEQKNREFLQQEFEKQNIEFVFEDFLSIRSNLLSAKKNHSDPHSISLENLTYLRKQVLEQFCKSLADSEKIVADALELFLDYRSQIEVPKEITQLLAHLKKSYSMVSVTNGNCNVEKTSLKPYFCKNYAPHLGYRAKPHNHMLCSVMTDFSLSANQILHIGDQLDTDKAAANEANCPFFHFSPFEKNIDYCEKLIDYLNL